MRPTGWPRRAWWSRCCPISTAAYDRGDKFALYGQNEALQDYVLVHTRQHLVEVHRRQPDGGWARQTYGPEATVVLPSLAVQIAVAAVYEDVDGDGS